MPKLRIASWLPLVSLLLCTAFLAAQETDDMVTDTLQARVEAFFGNLNSVDESEVQAVFTSLLADSPLARRDEDVKKLVAEFLTLEAKYGSFLAVEEISAKRIGTDLVLMRYLYKLEDFPIVWHFAFYRPQLGTSEKDGWKLIGLRFDTRLELLGL